MSEVKEDLVLVRREGAIAVLTLNNPRRMNAFSLAMRTQMWERVLELESDESCRAIVLTGRAATCAPAAISPRWSSVRSCRDACAWNWRRASSACW